MVGGGQQEVRKPACGYLAAQAGLRVFGETGTLERDGWMDGWIAMRDEVQ